MDLSEAGRELKNAVQSKKLATLVGECEVKYWGRAASRLPRGKRLLLVKGGDNSLSIHQNTKIRPVNYMMDAVISCAEKDGALLIRAEKRKPAEKIEVVFHSLEHFKAFEMEGKNDLRLFGSEKELSDSLAENLSFIEPGLKPVKREGILRKGIVDILAEDKDNNIVVIEVKRRQADFNAVTQLARYVEHVRKIKDRKIRGMLIAPAITETALEMLKSLGFEFFNLEFEISNPKAKIKGLEKRQPTINEFLK